LIRLENEPLKMRWFSELEQKMNRRFKNEVSFENIKKVGLQMNFNFGTGSGCNSGYCTD
jgi:hypothetical protein